MPMMNKTFENVQQLGKDWGEYGRRMSRDALRVMSGQLETAARYLDDLSQRLDQAEAPNEPSTSVGDAEPEPPRDAAN